MKLEGKWYLSVMDEKTTSTYVDATDVEILAEGRWTRFICGGKVYLTSYPVTMRQTLPGPARREEERGEFVISDQG